MTVKIKNLELFAEALEESYSTLDFLQRLGFDDNDPIHQQILEKIIENHTEFTPETPEQRESIGFAIWNHRSKKICSDNPYIYSTRELAERNFAEFLDRFPYIPENDYSIKEIFI